MPTNHRTAGAKGSTASGSSPNAGVRVLVVDDDPTMVGAVRRGLVADGLVVEAVATGEEALRMTAVGGYGLVVLDLSLPGVDGLAVLESVRRTSDLPVIVVSGRGTEGDRVMGLDMGADDYLAKPFSMYELRARVRSVLRRSAAAGSARVSTFGGLSIDLGVRSVKVGEAECDLTRREFDLLTFLATSGGRVCSREELLASVWGSSSAWQDADTVTEHVRRLRRKLSPERDEGNEGWIRTARGVGYRFDPAYEGTRHLKRGRAGTPTPAPPPATTEHATT